ncbi:MAG: GNAT family N-acetyltransferase [Nanoarchaeota archaeon]
MTEEIKIRKAEKKDFEEYFKLKLLFSKYHINIAGRFGIPLFDIEIPKKAKEKIQFFKRIRKIKGRLFIAEFKNKSVGYMYGYISKDKYTKKEFGYIAEVYVFDKYRNKCVFNELEKKMIHFFKNKKMKHVTLFVMNKNTKTHKIYEKKRYKVADFFMYKKI